MENHCPNCNLVLTAAELNEGRCGSCNIALEDEDDSFLYDEDNHEASE